MEPDESKARRKAWRGSPLGFILLSLLWWFGLPGTRLRGAEATNSPPAGSSSHPPAAESGPERLQTEVRLVVTTNAPAAVPEPKEKTVKWSLSCRGWDGLQFEAATKTSLKAIPPLPGLLTTVPNPMVNVHLEQVKMSGTFGGRLEVDGAAFVTTGGVPPFDDGIQLRRLRVTLKGDCILVLPVSYYIELGYSAGEFTLNQSSLTFVRNKYLGQLKAGQFQAPMGLQLIASSWDIPFMEPAAPLQALAPGIEAGIQIGQPVLDQRATWKLGLFVPGAGSLEYGNASRNYGSAVCRLTGLPYAVLDSTNSAADRLLHLGLSANILYSTTSTVRYQSRPESYLAPVVIDTGDINASSAATFAGEIAWVNGPFSAQGEFIGSVVEQSQAQALGFYGFYAQASWFLTGETRPYNRATGAFGRVIPRQKFTFGEGGWGAVEVAARYSYTDLDSDPIQGDRLGMLMTSVNWYLSSHVHWMFDYGMGHLSGGAQAGGMFIFQTRLGFSF